MKILQSFLFILLTSLMMSACTQSIDMNNYYAWCIVPFDSMERTPQERIDMLKDLGFSKYAYDWREKHLDSFPTEIKLAKENNIEIMAVWMWIDNNTDKIDSLSPSNERLLDILEQSGLKTQIWLGFHPNYFEGLPQQVAVDKGDMMLSYLKDRAEQLGCKIALYNHGDWFGDPRNQAQIIRQMGTNDVGIIYNFHHAHEQLGEFEEILDAAMPYLWSVNLNGMRAEGPKILDIGKGDLESSMMTIVESKGFTGPYGILCHIETEDARVVLQRNLDGLKKL